MKVRLLLITSIIAILSGVPIFALADESPEVTILETLHLQGGEVVQFMKTESGDILVAGRGPANSAQKLAGQQLETSASELFEYLSGRPAPEALIEAEKRAATAIEQLGAGKELPPPSSSVQLPLGTKEKATEELPDEFTGIKFLTAPGFRQRYCKTVGWDFMYCYLNNTCLYPLCGIQENSTYFYHTINPYKGNLVMAVQTWNGVRWLTGFQQTLFEGQVGWARSSGPKKYRRAIVLEAQGDGFHWEMHGNR